MRGLAIPYDDVVDINLKVWGGRWAVGLVAKELDEHRLPGHSSCGAGV